MIAGLFAMAIVFMVFLGMLAMLGIRALFSLLFWLGFAVACVAIAN